MRALLIILVWAVVLLLALQIFVYIQLQGQIWQLERENEFFAQQLDLVFNNIPTLKEVEQATAILKLFRGE